MAILTREQFLGHDDKASVEFNSELWGGTIIHHRATVADRAAARRRAQVAKTSGEGTETDYDKFGCVLAVLCSVNPKLEPQDADTLMEKSASEMERLTNSILGVENKNPR